MPFPSSSMISCDIMYWVNYFTSMCLITEISPSYFHIIYYYSDSNPNSLALYQMTSSYFQLNQIFNN